MNDTIKCPSEPSTMSITNAINALEGQAATFHNMLSSIEELLYGGCITQANAQEVKVAGLEDRLNAIVASNERALSRLDRAISKL